MRAVPLCDWAKGTIFLAECEAQAEALHLKFWALKYGQLAFEVSCVVLLACLAVAVWAYAWRHYRVGRGETRTRQRRTLVGQTAQARLEGLHAGSAIPSDAAQWAATASRSPVQAAASCTSTQTDLSIEPDQLIRWLSPDSSPASAFSHHSSRRARPNHSGPHAEKAKAPPDRAACTRQVQVPSVTPPSHTTRRSQRPAAERSSEKPDDQYLFTELAASRLSSSSSSFQEPKKKTERHSSSSSIQEPRPRWPQRRSPAGPEPQDKNLTPHNTPVARQFSKSKPSPNVKLSSGALFLAEMVRRHRERQETITETSPETPVQTPVLAPKSAWSKTHPSLSGGSLRAEARAYSEACEAQSGQDTVLAPRCGGTFVLLNERHPHGTPERRTGTTETTTKREKVGFIATNAPARHGAVNVKKRRSPPVSLRRSVSGEETKSAPLLQPASPAAAGPVRRTGTL